MNTVLGILCDELGLASTRVLEQGPTRPELRFKAWATPSLEVRKVQAARIPVDLGHDHDWVGEIIYLERDKTNRLWAVGHVQELPRVRVKVGDTTYVLENEPFYWSVERRAAPGFRDIIIDSVALTASPARVSPQPVKILDGDLNWQREPPGRWKPQLYPHELELLTRAAVAHVERKRHDPLLVHDLNSGRAEQHHGYAVRTTPPVEIRSAEQVGVSTTSRIIELNVAPYETPADVIINGRWCQEIYCRGSFDQIHTQGNKIRANRDHKLERTIGRAVAFDPHHPEGLIAHLKIAETMLGDETLALASEDCLSASAGFRCLKERWQGDTRLVVKGWLEHVALTPAPAYETADVLAVRGS